MMSTARGSGADQNHSPGEGGQSGPFAVVVLSMQNLLL